VGEPGAPVSVSQWHSHHPIPNLSLCQQIKHTESVDPQEFCWFWNTQFETWPVRESICIWCSHCTWTLAFGIFIHKNPVPVILGQLSLHLFSLNQCPRLHLHAACIIYMYGSIYTCEQMFSIMKLTKTSHWSCRTDQHLVSVLKVAMANDINPNIDKITFKKWGSVSGKIYF